MPNSGRFKVPYGFGRQPQAPPSRQFQLDPIQRQIPESPPVSAIGTFNGYLLAQEADVPLPACEQRIQVVLGQTIVFFVQMIHQQPRYCWTIESPPSG